MIEHDLLLAILGNQMLILAAVADIERRAGHEDAADAIMKVARGTEQKIAETRASLGLAPE